MDKDKFGWKKRHWGVLLLISAMILASGAYAFIQNTQGDRVSGLKLSSSTPVEPILNARAPDFVLETVDGDTVQLSDFRGQPVLINFWATWCGPCRIEMPAIQDRYERYQDDGLIVLAVNFDEPADAVESYGAELGLTFPLILDPGGEIQRRYRNRSYPTSFFVDAQGIIRAHHIGVMTEGQLDKNLIMVDIGQ